MYYRGANAAILVFDITKKASFEVLRDWVLELQTNLTSDLSEIRPDPISFCLFFVAECSLCALGFGSCRDCVQQV